MGDTPGLIEALTSWLTCMAQTGVSPDVINKHMSMMYSFMDYMEGDLQFYEKEAELNINDIIYTDFGYYDMMIYNKNMDAVDSKDLFDAVNSFLTFVSVEYKLKVNLLNTVNDHVWKRTGRITRAHHSLVNALKNMERKQKRALLGVLMERHRELKETDDFVREHWGDW